MSEEPNAARSSAELAELRLRLQEAEDALQAIRSGDVDAIIVSGDHGEQVFSLEGADRVYRLLVETMGESAVALDSEGTITFCNHRFSEFLNRPECRIVGRSLRDFLHPDSRLLLQELLGDQQTPPVRQRVVFRRSDGEDVPAHVSANLLDLPEGPKICLVATDLREIEESAARVRQLREEQDALARREEEFRAMFEFSAVGVVQGDPQTGRLTRANRKFCEMLGYAEEELVGRAWTEISHPDDYHEDRAALDQAIATTGLWSRQKRYIRKNGDILWANTNGTILRQPGTAPPRAMAVIVDVTAQKEAEDALRAAHAQLEKRVRERTNDLAEAVEVLEAEAALRAAAEEALRERTRLLEAFFQHTVTPLAFFDSAFNFIRVNDAFVRADRQGARDFFGKNYLDVYPDNEMKAAYEKVMETRKGCSGFNKPMLDFDHPEKGITYRNWRLMPLLDEQESVQYLVLVMEDVTEQRRAEEELQSANATLRHRALQLRRLASEVTLAEQRERGRLGQVLHDDLQQLLVGARFHISRALKSEDAKVRASAEEVNDLLYQAIDVSRSLTAELVPPILQEGGLVLGLEALARWMEEKQGLRVRLVAKDGLTAASKAHDLMLYQSIRELLFNVVKHAKTDTATVTLRQGDDSIVAEVSDEGVGFDPDEAPLQSRSHDGFGLFSVQERLDLLGGSMSVDSAPGQGARFTLAVPVSVAEPQDGAPAAVPAPSRISQMSLPLKTRSAGASAITRVLLVDDHDVVRQSLARLLEGQEDIVVAGQADNGELGVRMARELSPDVVLMDISMPGMNGIEATRRIRAELPEVNVIGLSMFEEAERAEAMREAGACTYLSKAVSSEILLNAIRSLVQ